MGRDSRIAPGNTAYIHSHIERMIKVADLDERHSILEVGSGLGKFTMPLLDKGYRITANDLSPHLLGRLVEATDSGLEAVCCDIHDIARHTDAKFDRLVGFFVLHHLIDFDRLFAKLAEVTKPGGRIAFCEPVSRNPLYYLQIALTPGMHFAGEPSIAAMRRGVIFPAMQRAGFVDAQSHRYGYFPPALKNTAWGDGLERWLDSKPLVPFPNAFQIFTARLPA